LASLRIAIIGAGIYGLHAAKVLVDNHHEVIIFDKESYPMQGASLLNQSRVHGGYHYPRALQTAGRSQRNYLRFLSDFSESIERNFTSIYAIAKDSKVSPKKFEQLARIIGAPIKLADKEIFTIFNKILISDVFQVDEVSYNSNVLRKIMLDKLNGLITLRLDTEIVSCQLRYSSIQKKSSVYLSSTFTDYEPFDLCINASYGEFSDVNSNNGKLSFEVCELMHVVVPSELSEVAITVIDGPYFSLTPWPSFGNHVLTHVRFTPHSKHHNFHEAYERVLGLDLVSRHEITMRDSARYIPIMSETRYLESKFAVKTVLASRDSDDARPIITSESERVLNIIGSKVDNIYDIEDVVLNFTERYKS
jgi:hypothetical protein